MCCVDTSDSMKTKTLTHRLTHKMHATCVMRGNLGAMAQHHVALASIEDYLVRETESSQDTGLRKHSKTKPLRARQKSKKGSLKTATWKRHLRYRRPQYLHLVTSRLMAHHRQSPEMATKPAIRFCNPYFRQKLCTTHCIRLIIRNRLVLWYLQHLPR